VLCEDGTRDLRVPPSGTVKSLVSMIESLSPAAVELYADRAATKLLHREAEPEKEEMPVQPVGKLRGERMLIVFAQLLQKAHETANRNNTAMMSRAASLLEKVERRAERWEQVAQQLHEALMAQTQANLAEREERLAEREDTLEERGGGTLDSELMQQFVAGLAASPGVSQALKTAAAGASKPAK
jgi:hypothetical protein